jgi:hypothetical protein
VRFIIFYNRESVAYRSFAYPIHYEDPFLAEVSEKLPQGELACGCQAFIAPGLFDPSMSALLIIPLQKAESVRLFTGK